MLLIQNARILGHNGVEDILVSDEGKYLKTKDGLIVPVERPGYPKEYARRMHKLSPKNMEIPQ